MVKFKSLLLAASLLTAFNAAAAPSSGARVVSGANGLAGLSGPISLSNLPVISGIFDLPVLNGLTSTSGLANLLVGGASLFAPLTSISGSAAGQLISVGIPQLNALIVVLPTSSLLKLIP